MTENHFRLYEEGFPEDDFLERKEVGRRLSSLLERMEEPIVVALDGRWGSGKTHFLQRWVGAHTLQNEGKAKTIYFDAFENDFLDDPLIALISAIGARLSPGEKDSIWKSIKAAAVSLSRPAIRVGAAAISSGLSEFLSPVLAASVDQVSKETTAAIDEFWKREEARREAILRFKEGLKAFSNTSDGREGCPLIIVIDELDRCRPDYALSILEVIKHFFAVPNVHFVFGVNLDALAHSVRARYGNGIDATAYLSRFVTLSMILPEEVSTISRKACVQYFQKMVVNCELSSELSDQFARQIELASRDRNINLRSIDRLLLRISLFVSGSKLSEYYKGWQIICVSILLIQVLNSTLHIKLLKGSAGIIELKEFFNVNDDELSRDNERYDHTAYLVCGVWSFILSESADMNDDIKDFASLFGHFTMRDKRSKLRGIHNEFFEYFSVSD